VFLKQQLNTIIAATNKTTADFILHSSLLESEYKISIKEKKPVDNREIVATTQIFCLQKRVEFFSKTIRL
jgi:hypothetical protein